MQAGGLIRTDNLPVLPAKRIFLLAVGLYFRKFASVLCYLSKIYTRY